jgi:Cu2+-exporting ATPase
MKSIHLNIHGIRCAACVNKIETTLLNYPGIHEVLINQVNGNALIHYSSDKLKIEDIIQLINNLGYMSNELKSDSSFSAKLESRKMLWKWMVAGICMMQIMMLSMPSYLFSYDEIIDYKPLLDWASWVIVLPVMLFSAQDIFKNSLNDILQKKVSMDLPIAFGISLMFIFSSLATFDSNSFWGEEIYFDSIAMFIFFILTSRWIELKVKSKMFNSVNNFLDTDSKKVEILSGKIKKMVAIDDIKVGEFFLVHPGNQIPLDGVIISGITSCNESLITGESIPIPKQTSDYVYAGSINLTNTIKVRCTNDYNASKLQDIRKLIRESLTKKPSYSKIIDKLAQPFLVTVIALALFSFIFHYFYSPENSIKSMIAILVVTCPCALSLSTPVALMASANKLINNGIFVRDFDLFEKIPKIKNIVFDKTGTLTNTRAKIINSHWVNSCTDNYEKIITSLTKDSSHPFSKALFNNFYKGEVLRITNFIESPGEGISASFNGKRFYIGSYKFCRKFCTGMKEYKSHQIYFVNDTEPIASFQLGESLKSNLIEAMNFFKLQNINLFVFSGDKMKNIQKIIPNSIFSIFSSMNPSQKLLKLKMIQKQSSTLMIGDGFNDGPAFAAASASISMNHSPHSIKHLTDAVVVNNDLLILNNLFLQAHKTLKIIKQNMFWAISYNFLMIPFAFSGYIEPWLAGLGMSMSSLVVVVNSYRLLR